VDVELAHDGRAVRIRRLHADTEDAGLVDRRVKAVKQQVAAAWDASSYPLTIEPEIFWRKGAPPKHPNARSSGGR